MFINSQSINQLKNFSLTNVSLYWWILLIHYPVDVVKCNISVFCKFPQMVLGVIYNYFYYYLDWSSEKILHHWTLHFVFIDSLIRAPAIWQRCFYQSQWIQDCYNSLNMIAMHTIIEGKARIAKLLLIIRRSETFTGLFWNKFDQIFLMTVSSLKYRNLWRWLLGTLFNGIIKEYYMSLKKIAGRCQSVKLFNCASTQNISVLWEQTLLIVNHTVISIFRSCSWCSSSASKDIPSVWGISVSLTHPVLVSRFTGLQIPDNFWCPPSWHSVIQSRYLDTFLPTCL